jgi:predicted membrane-bound spermidine synthase
MLGTAATFRLLAAAAGVFLALRVRAVGRFSGGGALLAAAMLAALVVFPDSQRLWATLHGATPARALAAEDASGISLVRASGDGTDTHLVMAGGLGLSEFPYGTYGGVHTLLGALPVLIHPAPRRVAVIGLGSGDTTFGVGARPDVEEIVTIEIIGSQLDALREFQERVGYPGLDVLFSDPRFRFVVGDGRTHVRRDPRPYDVIEADALRPSSAYAGNLYSLEYFALLRAKLAPGGMAVTWLPTERVRDTFARSFPHVLVLRDIGFGSDSPIPFDRAAVLARCQEPAVRAHFETIGLDLCQLLGEFLAQERRPFRLGPEDDRTRFRDVNSDLFAKDEFLIGGRSW